MAGTKLKNAHNTKHTFISIQRMTLFISLVSTHFTGRYCQSCFGTHSLVFLSISLLMLNIGEHMLRGKGLTPANSKTVNSNFVANSKFSFRFAHDFIKDQRVEQ